MAGLHIRKTCFIIVFLNNIKKCYTIYNKYSNFLYAIFFIYIQERKKDKQKRVYQKSKTR